MYNIISIVLFDLPLLHLHNNDGQECRPTELSTHRVDASLLRIAN